MVYGGLMAIEVGKNRLEALGEVEEAADLIRYYAKTASDNDFYDHPMDSLGDAAVHTRSILRPHGVFAVISPFNFPMALAGGPSAAAMLAGNTVVFKPSSAAPISGVKLVEAYREAGVPDGVINLVMGPGRDGRRGAPREPRHRRDRLHRLVRGRDGPLPDVLDATTRSRRSSRWAARTRPSSSRTRGPRRGGRGDHALAPSASAARSARPTAGSTSRSRSTTSSSGSSSRRPRRSRSATRSCARTGSARSSTRRRSTATRQAVAEARRDGRVFIGGERLTDRGMERGFYVEPTVVGDLPADHRLFRDELFAPFTAVAGRRLVRRGDPPRERLGLRPDRRRLQRGPGRGPALPRHDRGRRPVRQPPGRRDDRRLAGRPGVRRLEGLRLDRQGRPVDVLRRPVPAGAEPHRRRLRPWRPGSASGMPVGGTESADQHASRDLRRATSRSGSGTASRSTTSHSTSGRVEVFGFLGPNGAGKTTTVPALGTLDRSRRRGRRPSPASRSRS